MTIKSTEKRREFLAAKTAERAAQMKTIQFPIRTKVEIYISRDDLVRYVAYRLLKDKKVHVDADHILRSRRSLLNMYRIEMQVAGSMVVTWQQYLQAAHLHDRRVLSAMDHAERILDALKFARPKRDSGNQSI